MNNFLFSINLIVHICLLSMVIYSIYRPKKRIWPPPSNTSRQYKIYWGLYYLTLFLDFILVFICINSWFIPPIIQIYLGIPLILIGFIIMVFGVYTLGIKNTYGLKDGFCNSGIYQYTRNPQYIGDILLFSGLILFVNSSYLSILFFITIVTFVLMPFSEEIWLQETYGKKYLEYKRNTRRFF